MADVLEISREPSEETTPEGEDVALREEFALLSVPGHLRRTGWIVRKFQEFAGQLALGQINDDAERHRAEGRCQAYKEMLDRDDTIREGYLEMKQAENEAQRGDQLEGGNHGVNYEAAG